MANITVADFRARLPEFSDASVYPDPVIQVQIDDSALLIAESAFGDKWPIAQTYFVAHNIVLNDITKDNSAAGGATISPVSSETEGDTSVSYAVKSQEGRATADELLSSTLYGQRYLAIRATCVVGGISTGCPVNISC